MILSEENRKERSRLWVKCAGKGQRCSFVVFQQFIVL